MCFSFKKKKVGLSLVVVMVIVMRVNTIMTDIMRTKKSIPVGASKDKVLHATNGSNLIHFVSCNVTNPQDSKDLPPPFLMPTALFLTDLPFSLQKIPLNLPFLPCGVHHETKSTSSQKIRLNYGRIYIFQSKPPWFQVILPSLSCRCS